MGGILNQIATVGDSIPTPQKIEAQNNALQSQRQALAMGKVQLTEATEAQQARHAMNAVFAQAAQRGTDVNDADLLAAGGIHATPVIEARNKMRQSLATLQETQLKNQQAEAELMGAAGAKIHALGDSPDAVQSVLSTLPPALQQHAAPLLQHIQDPKQLADTLIAGSEKARAAAAAELKARADALEANIKQQKLPGELKAQDLGNTAKQQEITGTKPIQPAEQLQIQRQQEQLNEQKRHNTVEEKQGSARLGIAGAELGIKQKQFNATYGAGLGEDGKPLDQTKTGEDYLKMLPPGIANQVRAMAEGRMAAPSASSRNPQAAMLRNALLQYDPNFNEQRAQVRKAFTTGSDGRNIGALNTATVHLDQLEEAAQALKNGSFTPKNAVFNKLVNTFGGAAPTNFEGVKAAVASEMASALKGNATDQEIKNTGSQISAASSPEQLQGIIKQNLHILGAKLNTYQERYSAQNPGDKVWSPVLPSAKAVYEKHSIDPTAGPATNIKSGKGPKVGAVEDGYVFLGGDPSNPKSWKKQ